ncbi:ABC transporter permease, partial [Thioclava sp. BHET1]
MNKKDLGLLFLILAVGAVVAVLNPRFLMPINIANTSNLVGLFGLSALGQAFVIITGGIELSVGSMMALIGVLFVDFIAVQGLPWPVAVVLMLLLG